ncbi:DUF4426 domain-containing protein [Halomonas sp.]|uniref:DUF4426 domain-containing protein n=1 Tax=Halomonas sp. TaxID=1486246 RepID=UPI0025C1DEFA|nr:DUF4426 domain-containing protein [Halomonas sp.]
MKPGILAFLAVSALALLSGHAAAQQYEQIDNYQIHYSAVNTSFLPEEVAREHGIQRSNVMALLNVSVLEERDDGTTRALPVSVNGTVGGLSTSDARTPLSFRTLRGGDAPSQVAVFRIHDDEAMHFDLEVLHDRNADPARVSFIQRFYIDR